ncbi:HlyD family type I secretion periplasmic adaptor subunit [Roseomonas xinghualingensis]|uniref:HlyD family type I secretion periplasmic adaptor subunit n=1 Tax=Roseomonas xinghualingensis TaxID=2986475 RepID=UPI0021F1A2F8|nr:HlyD family type I secretion periplasmic adaptor subunit [Roseomonas sp. SXEYE001]MCV4208326.1 HlyD family type I secretion periplasmic adaptor subunit [Roseomonas sp. SXEYE001]
MMRDAPPGRSPLVGVAKPLPPEGRSTTKVVPLQEKRPVALREFQADVVEIEEREPHRVTRLTLYTVAALIVSAVVWAAVSEVDRVVVAPGRLVSTVPNLVVQPLETSAIRSVNVSVGDVVKAGSTLATLDPTFSAADLAQLRVQLANRSAHVARLEAEVEGRRYVAPPRATEDERLQALSYAQRAAFRQARLRDFDQRVARTRAGIATNRTDQQMLTPRLEVLREVEIMRSQLLAGQVGSRINLLDARNQRLDVEGRIEHLRQGLLEMDAELERTYAERESFIQEFRQTALEELVKLRSERDAIAENLTKAALRREMVVLTAPSDAVVLEVAKRSVGSVAREAETLFVLVPLNAPLEAELALEAKDVGRLATNQEVRVKLDAFPYQEHGVASGLLRTISEGTFAREQEQETQQNREAVFRARIQLTDTRLRSVPETFRLIPGMTVMGEIKIGHRNVLSYFLYPILRGFDESLREP